MSGCTLLAHPSRFANILWLRANCSEQELAAVTHLTFGARVSLPMARIFVLDDEDSIVRTWVLILTKFGYETTGFSHPHDALAAIRQTPPDLLVSDVGLPSMTG